MCLHWEILLDIKKLPFHCFLSWFFFFFSSRDPGCIFKINTVSLRNILSYKHILLFLLLFELIFSFYFWRNNIIFIVYVCVCLFVCVHTMYLQCLWSLKEREGCTWLWAATWVLEIEPRSSTRVSRALNHGAVCPDLSFSFFNCRRVVVKMDWFRYAFTLVDSGIVLLIAFLTPRPLHYPLVFPITPFFLPIFLSLKI